MITLIALPTIWLVNRAEDGPGSPRPNVAAAGLSPGDADARSATSSPHTGDARRFDPMGDGDAVYVATQDAPPASVPEVAVGTTADDPVGAARATYSSDVSAGSCEYNGVDIGREITVTNVANSRSVECTAGYLGGGGDETIVLAASDFQEIADIVAAPVHVEIRS